MESSKTFPFEFVRFVCTFSIFYLLQHDYIVCICISKGGGSTTNDAIPELDKKCRKAPKYLSKDR